MSHTVIESNLKNLFAIVIITMWFQISEIERNHFDGIPLFRKAHRKQKGSLSHSSPFESIRVHSSYSSIQVYHFGALFKFAILISHSGLSSPVFTVPLSKFFPSFFQVSLAHSQSLPFQFVRAHHELWKESILESILAQIHLWFDLN